MAWLLPGGAGQALMPPLSLAPSLVTASTGPLGEAFAAGLRHAPLVVLVLMQLYSGSAAEEANSTQQEDTKCSKALGFNDTHVPKDRSAQDLAFCFEHDKRTCCEREQTRTVLGWFAPISTGNYTQKCITMSKVAGCGHCDGDVGTGEKADGNVVRLCPSLCARWFKACFEDFFAPRGAGRIQGCSQNSLLCSPAGEIFERAEDFCASVGSFAVAESEEDADACFDGIPAARSKGRGPRQPWARPSSNLPWWRELMQRWAHLMPQQNYGSRGTFGFLYRVLPRNMARTVEQNMPLIIVTCVVLFMGYILFREM